MKVFIPRVIPDIGLQILTEAGCTITQFTDKRDLSREEMIRYCQQNDALLNVGFKIDADFLRQCSHLKVIALLSVGFDNVDVAEATRLRIPIGNTPGVLSNATADTAFLLMLAVSRRAFYMHKLIPRGEWGSFESTTNLGIELNGLTLGIFGMGKIGFELARKCKGAFGMKIIYHNRRPNEKAEKELGASLVSFDVLLEQSDVISLHAALTDETRGLFDQKAFGKMKPSSIFINTARGGMHNEKDLLAALQTGTIWGAGLDVTNPEPMDKDNPLLDMPCVAVLPHIGSATVEARNGMATIAAKNILAGLKGEPLPCAVNPEIYS